MTTKNELEGRHIVVTGGSGALGGAVLEVLLERGAHCHVPCVEPEVPGHFALASHERVSATAAIDLASEESTRDYFRALPNLWGSVHLAGGFAMSKLTDTTLAELESMLDINLVTSFLCCRESVRSMRRGGGGGRIVNVAARPVVRPQGGMAAYSCSKAAVAALTQSLGDELVGENILVNAIMPSVIDTPANRRSMPDADHAAWPKAAEIAQTIAFLVGPSNALTAGALVPVFGRG
jgi:NAD(P)-dependent dehydrogenase (short-subunit alcohol dehydrogenase family)